MRHVILTLPDLVPGGAQRVFIDLAKSLTDAGYKTTAIVAYPSRGEWSFSPATHVIRLSDTEYGFWSTLMLPILFFRLRKLLRNEHPDAVISTLTGMNLLTILAADYRLRDYPVIVREASTMQNTASLIIRSLKKWLYPRATAIIAVSEGVVNELESSIGLPRSNLHIINNPVNKKQLKAASKTDVAHKWLKEKSCPVFIAVGRLTEAKDYGTLIRALELVRLTLPAKLVIIGEGPERPGLERLVDSLKLNDAVDMPGHFDNPYALMARADVFVLSSRWEGFVNVLLEALALGMPIASTDCHSSPREILDNGKYGHLAPPGNPQMLAESMLQALNSPLQSEHQESRADDYSPDAIFKKYRLLIDDLTG
jgi:glycosyltransferase involved in cell wall biosynthesis